VKEPAIWNEWRAFLWPGSLIKIDRKETSYALPRNQHLGIFIDPLYAFQKNWRKHEYDKNTHSLYFSYWLCARGLHKKLLHTAKQRSESGV
jgi:hypothetical protein